MKGLSPRVVLILMEEYNLLFRIKPPTRKRLIRSGYVNATKYSCMKKTLPFPLKKQAVARVKTQSSLAFYNCLFLVHKPKWRLGPQYFKSYQDFQNRGPKVRLLRVVLNAKRNVLPKFECQQRHPTKIRRPQQELNATKKDTSRFIYWPCFNTESFQSGNVIGNIRAQ